ncbi:MAG: toxin-antitoxin system YwqK family antitoxin [Lentimicrobiaceae bacterium]|jgi:antitoxin component YwqK of YwqJK toxin-antitoxin module|nr:toxin-antitoxin system YwqK family antitoxin [Lentimicrobiaceae bacterium]
MINNGYKILFFAFFVLSFVACKQNNEDPNLRKSYWDNGNLKSELRYEDGQLNGLCTWFYESGKPQMSIRYKNNKMMGESIRWFDNGEIESRYYYVDNKLDSVYQLFNYNGIMTEESYYVNDTLDGPYRKWYADGALLVDGGYKKGMMDGSWLTFYPDGEISSRTMFNMGSGFQVGYHQNNYKVLELSYKDNLKHGTETHFDGEGNITKILKYEEGILVE